MEKRVEEVVQEIGEVCKEAKLIEDPKNFIHVLIAYLRVNKVKTEEDYTINAIVAVIIHDTLAKLKDNTISLALNELAILCKAIMIYDEHEAGYGEITEDIEISEEKNV